MNIYVISQINNMISIAKTFNDSCRMAASKDDGKIDKTEEKQLKKIYSATERFINELNKIKQH